MNYINLVPKGGNKANSSRQIKFQNPISSRDSPLNIDDISKIDIYNYGNNKIEYLTKKI